MDAAIALLAVAVVVALLARFALRQPGPPPLADAEAAGGSLAPGGLTSPLMSWARWANPGEYPAPAPETGTIPADAVVETKIAGVSRGNRQTYLERIAEHNFPGVCMALDLEREPDNPADENAVAVTYAFRDGRRRLGYLPHRIAAAVAPFMDAGGRAVGILDRLSNAGDESNFIGARIRVCLHANDDDALAVTLPKRWAAAAHRDGDDPLEREVPGATG